MENLYNGERMGMIDMGLPEIPRYAFFIWMTINISVQTVACNIKHADPQINSVREVFSKFHCVEWSLNPTFAPLSLPKHPFHFKNQTPHPFS